MSRDAALQAKRQQARTANLANADFEKMPAAERKSYMAFTAPKDRRDNCRGCQFCTVEVVRPDTFDESQKLRCSVGEFTVPAGGVCEHWEKAK